MMGAPDSAGVIRADTFPRATGFRIAQRIFDRNARVLSPGVPSKK